MLQDPNMVMRRKCSLADRGEQVLQVSRYSPTFIRGNGKKVAEWWSCVERHWA